MRTRNVVLGRPPVLGALIFCVLFLLSSLAYASQPASRLRVALDYSGDPEPGHSFTVICSVMCDIDTMCTASSVLTLLPGMTSGGENTIEFEATAGDGVISVHQYSVVAGSEGIYEIHLCSSSIIDTTSTINDCALLNILVSSNPDSMGVTALSRVTLPDGSSLLTLESESITVEDDDFPYYVEMAPMPIDSIPNRGEPNDSLYGGPALALGTITVTGRVVYGRQFYDGGSILIVPLVNATINIWDSDTYCGTDDLIGQVLTDSDGYYSKTVSNGDCSGTADIYVEIRLDNENSHVVDFFPGSVNNLPYKFYTPTYDDAGSGTLYMGTFLAGGSGSSFAQHACNVFDALNKAWSFVHAAGSTYDMRPVTAQYGSHTTAFLDEANHTDTYYDGPDIVIAEPENFDLWTVGHEYGHAVQDFFGDNISGSSCPNLHYEYLDTDQQCAWEEGFADFFGTGVAELPGLLEARIFDEGGITSAQALRTEACVSRALWDLYDSSNDSYHTGDVGRDLYSTGLATFLSVLKAYDCKGSFSTFWTRWKQAGKPKHLPVQAIRYNFINFNTVPAWTSIPNQTPHSGYADTLNVYPYISDPESSDGELEITVNSNSSSHATLSWISPGVLRAVYDQSVGNTIVTLKAYDGLSNQVSSSFTITWITGGGKGGEEPPDPCEGPCPYPNFMPKVTDLGPATPNPFNPQTNFFYDLEFAGNVKLAIYDVLGRQVRTFVNRHQAAGRYAVTWDGKDDRGMRQSSGVYFAVLVAGGQQFTSKLVLLK